ncbi:MAG: NUDIX domain-containing protein [Rhodoglobus sp.]
MTGPVVPRAAATVLLVREPPMEVLMLRRNSRGTFPDAVVFPGGVVDESDLDPSWDDLVTGTEGLSREQQAVRIAGIRETWEEVGLLVCQAGPAPADLDRNRPFIDLIRAGGTPLALDELHYLARWVTPEGRPRRFDTRFYVSSMPAGQDATADGGEAVALEWIAPHEALQRADSGQQPLMPPTRLNLARLAEEPDLSSVIEAARARARFIVHPRATLGADGVRRVRILAEAGYGPADIEFETS